MAIDEYFLYYPGWESQGSSERCQWICMRILLPRYMIDVKVFEPLGHVDSCVMIRYQVFMSDLVLPANLVNDELESPYTSRFLIPIS